MNRLLKEQKNLRIVPFACFRGPTLGTDVVHSARLCRGRAPNRAAFSPNSSRTITLPGICVRWHIAAVPPFVFLIISLCFHRGVRCVCREGSFFFSSPSLLLSHILPYFPCHSLSAQGLLHDEWRGVQVLFLFFQKLIFDLRSREEWWKVPMFLQSSFLEGLWIPEGISAALM